MQHDDHARRNSKTYPFCPNAHSIPEDFPDKIAKARDVLEEFDL